jgi:preprotein translocase subunit YajC
MSNWISDTLVLAQEAGGGAPAGGAAPGGANPPQGGMFVLLMPILVAFAVMLFMSTRQNKREQTKRMQMIRGLSKNDRVVTIGGILGSVVSISEDASEVTLKMVDDSRIKFRADAIREVLTETTPAKT